MGTRKDYAYGKSKYVKAEDLVGKTVRVTISDVEDVQFDDKGVKPVLSFEGKEKGLVVNATNFDTLAASLGSNTMDRTRDRAQGRKGSLQGQMVDSIKVSVPAQTKPKQPEQSKQEPPPFDDGIPDFAA
jgi:hypothetical protein